MIIPLAAMKANGSFFTDTELRVKAAQLMAVDQNAALSVAGCGAT
jgi:hypothetical protein